MKILITAPLKRKVATSITAARPRVVFDLVAGLIKKGHQVSLLGTSNSKVKGAKTIAVSPKSIIEMRPFENEFVARVAYLTKQAKILEKIGDKFDIIHNHSRPEFFNLFAQDKLKTPILTTLHAVMEKETDEAFACFKKHYLVCISRSASRLVKKNRVYKIIPNGVDSEFYKFQPKKQDYLFWLGRLGKAKDKKGRFVDAKGVRWAIKLAQKTNSRLLLAGSVEDPEFFERDVKPHLSSKIKWVAPISKEQPLSKQQVVKLMQGARAFLMTVNWQEPFGLVMAEAQSCGTPVIGFKRGSVPELVRHNKTGFVVPPSQGLKGLKKALSQIDRINPRDCQKHIEENFSLRKMVENYEEAYQEVISNAKE